MKALLQINTCTPPPNSLRYYFQWPKHGNKLGMLQWMHGLKNVTFLMKYSAMKRNKPCHLLTNCMKLEYIMLTKASQKKDINKKNKN